MREIRLSGSEGGGFECNRFSLPLSSNGLSTGLKGNQIHRFGGRHLAEIVAFGHTNAPAGRTRELPPHSKPGKFRPKINASNYPPAHPAGKAR